MMNISYNHMRLRFSGNRKLAERFFSVSTELDDYRIDTMAVGPNLPFPAKNDPGILILYVKGHDNKKDKDFEYVLFEEDEEPGLAWRAYHANLMSQYHPVTDDDYEKLPDSWGVSFVAEKSSDEPLLHVRSVCTAEGIEPFDVDTGEYVNLINTEVDSELRNHLRGEEEWFKFYKELSPLKKELMDLISDWDDDLLAAFVDFLKDFKRDHPSEEEMSGKWGWPYIAKFRKLFDKQERI